MDRLAFVAIVAVWVVAPNAAHAYLDPATGSVVLQVLVGSVMGGVFIVKRYWRELKARFTRKSAGDAPATTEKTRSDG